MNIHTGHVVDSSIIKSLTDALPEPDRSNILGQFVEAKPENLEQVSEGLARDVARAELKSRGLLEDALRKLAGDESGIAVTEYGLLIALIAILLISVVVIFGSSIASWFQAKTSAITSI